MLYVIKTDYMHIVQWMYIYAPNVALYTAQWTLSKNDSVFCSFFVMPHDNHFEASEFEGSSKNIGGRSSTE